MIPMCPIALKRFKEAGLEANHPIGDFVNELTGGKTEHPVSKPQIAGLASGSGATKVDPTQFGGSPEGVPSGVLASDETAVGMIKRFQ